MFRFSHTSIAINKIYHYQIEKKIDVSGINESPLSISLDDFHIQQKSPLTTYPFKNHLNDEVGIFFEEWYI